MRGNLIVIVLLLVAASQMSGMRKADLAPAKTAAPSDYRVDPGSANEARETTANRVDFATQVKPILVSRCEGCHFPGGKMYQRLPFDRAETIKTLGEKLFTRLKDENDRRLIRDFLAQ
ncbi:MAG: hypothetical protein QOE77_579 [Blastocatellia bacterium]|jgi:hypothetical protein|nr:hypothetical protein [Blastocatellia bacterium]